MDQHPTFDLLAVRAAELLRHVHPQFAGTTWVVMVVDETTPEALHQADLVFLALPHGESTLIVQTRDADDRVLHPGAGFRFTSADARGSYYGGDQYGSWTYSLPELSGRRDKSSAFQPHRVYPERTSKSVKSKMKWPARKPGSARKTSKPPVLSRPCLPRVQKWAPRRRS